MMQDKAKVGYGGARLEYGYKDWADFHWKEFIIVGIQNPAANILC